MQIEKIRRRSNGTIDIDAYRQEANSPTAITAATNRIRGVDA